MSENFGFIKKIRSQKSRDLKRDHPASYLVLDTIAENAKWDDKPCKLGLEKGESIITYSACGVSPQQFETALKYLESNEYIKIVHRGRKDKDSEFLARIKPETLPDSILNTPRINGTVVKLIDSSIWDLNIDQTPKHLPNQTRNTSGFTPNKEEIKNKEEKKEEQPAREARKAAQPPDGISLNKRVRIEEEYLCRSTCFSEKRSDNTCKALNSNELSDNKNNYLSSKKKSIQPSSQAIELLSHFESSLAKHIPEVSLPLKKSQSKNFDSLLKKHDLEKIQQAFQFAHQHYFWRQRIHSVSDLERNFSKILAELNAGKKQAFHPPPTHIANGKEFETEIDPFLLKITGERVYEL